MTLNQRIKCVAVFENSTHLKGYVSLRENPNDPQQTIIQAQITGLQPNRKYAWHIHEAGDLRSSGCSGACAHYNPFKQTHGGLHSRHRHVGDLGNLTTNSLGESHSRITTRSVKLKGKYSVVGRSVVIHEKPDDLGQGGTEESLITGSAGARIACGVIGYAKDSKLY